MYPLTDMQKHILQENVQLVRITMDDLTITEQDILEGGLVISRSTQSGTSIEIGSVVAAELALQLQNFDGRFDDVDFEGQTLDVSFVATDHVDVVTLPMGKFIVDSVSKKNLKIQITALDKMAAFDKVAVPWTGVKSLWQVILWCASQCGVACNLTQQDLSVYPNYSVTVDYPDGDEEHTYRELLSWACECMGICAYAWYTGELKVGWYSDTGLRLTESERKEGSTENAEKAIMITGVKIDSTQFGNDGYVIQVQDNDFASTNITIGVALNAWLAGFVYRPMSTTVRTMPWLWPLDGDNDVTIITNATHKLNGYTALSAKGESLTKTGMAKSNPLTRRESALVKQLQAAASRETDAKIESILLMQDLAAYSMGLYPHPEQQTDGSWVFTFSDAPELEDSTKVYRFNANGFFVSNDGGQTWNSGLDADGNLIVHILTADMVVTGVLQDATGTNFWNLDTGELRMVGAGISIGARNYVRHSNTLDYLYDGFVWFFEFNGEQATLNGNLMEVMERG